MVLVVPADAAPGSSCPRPCWLSVGVETELAVAPAAASAGRGTDPDVGAGRTWRVELVGVGGGSETGGVLRLRVLGLTPRGCAAGAPAEPPCCCWSC